MYIVNSIDITDFCLIAIITYFIEKNSLKNKAAEMITMFD